MCEFFTEVVIRSTELISAPGIIRYVQTMYRTGDEFPAKSIFNNLFPEPIIDPDYVGHLLEGRASIVLTDTTAVLAVPNQWIIKEETPS